MAMLRVVCDLLVSLLFCHIIHRSSGEYMPPQIEVPLSQDQRVVVPKESEHYTVQCKARGNPSPTFQWKKDDIFLDDLDDSVKSFKNGSLYFRNFTNTDDGFYQCYATNKLGTSVSVKFLIIKSKPAVKSVGYQHTKIEVETGLSASLECSQLPDTVPKWNPRWYQTFHSEEIRETDRIGTDSQGILRFAFVEPGDAKSYICGLAPSFGSNSDSIIFYNTIELVVKPVAAETGNIPPRIEYGSKETKAVLGDSVTMECFFSGRPVPKIKWTSNSNQRINPGNSKFVIHDYHRKLTIRNVQEEDQGTFICSADNGFREAKHIINLNVTSAPIKIPHRGLNSAVRTDRDDILLHCKAKPAFGETLNVPVWYRNGQLLNEATVPDQHRYRFSSHYTELTIKSPNNTTDTACFQCNVSNSEGYVFYDGYLKVIESIKITKKPAAAYKLSINDVIDISVHATGDDCCRIVKEWYLNGVRLTHEELSKPPFVHQGVDSLMFSLRNISNETIAPKLGHYKCNVSNIYDFQEVEFTIQLLDENAGMTGSGSDNIYWVPLLCVILLIIITVIIVVVVMKTRYHGQTYHLEKKELQHNLNPKEDLLNQSFQEI